MSAQVAFDAASSVGLRIDLDGEDLILEADAPPPADVLDLLASFKQGIVAELRRRERTQEWDAMDWRAFFDERAGVLEFDAGLPCAEAEARAHADCVAEWLNRHPVASDPSRCLTCGQRERNAAEVVQTQTLSGQASPHPACWPVWREACEAAAIDALRKLGIARPQEEASR